MTAELWFAGLGDDNALHQTVLAQVRWGYHDSIDPAATAALRTAHP